MNQSDQRYLLRRKEIERAKAANKLVRAFMQFRKWLVSRSYVRKRVDLDFGNLGLKPQVFVTVAFNSPALIGLQAQALARFISDDFSLIVVDNSTEEEQRESIRNLAGTFGFHYVPAPTNPFSWMDPSLSHSVVLDWAWRNIVRPIRPRTVVLLDHDVLPTGPADIGHLLQGAMAAGYRRHSGKRWLLWPGLLALDFERIDVYSPSFLPRRDTDSGGSMWWRVYSRVPTSSLRFLGREELVFADTSERFGDGSSGEVHLLDGLWLHLVDGSGWSDGVGKIGKLPLHQAPTSVDDLIQLTHSIRRAEAESDFRNP